MGQKREASDHVTLVQKRGSGQTRGRKSSQYRTEGPTRSHRLDELKIHKKGSPQVREERLNKVLKQNQLSGQITDLDLLLK